MLGRGVPPSVQTQDHVMERGGSFKGCQPPNHHPFTYKLELKVLQMAVVRIIEDTGKHLAQNRPLRDVRYNYYYQY